MEQPKTEDKIIEAYKDAKEFFQDDDYSKTLEEAEKSISMYAKEKHCSLLHWLQGTCFGELARNTRNPYVKCTFFFSSLESFSMSTLLLPDSIRVISCFAHSLYYLAEELQSDVYYRKALNKAKQALSIEKPFEMLEGALDPPVSQDLDPKEIMPILKSELGLLIELSEEKMKSCEAKTVSDFRVEVKKKARDLELPVKAKTREEMRNFWAGMDVKSKRDFLIVDIEELLSFIGNRYGSHRREVLKGDIESAKQKKRWRLWKCGSCSEEFHRSSEFRKHIERNHTEKFRPSEDLIVERVDDSWGEMISCEEWEPVDKKAAAEKINDRLANGEAISFVKGWSKDFWTEDKKRRDVLKEFGKLLESLVVHKLLSCGLKDWLIEFTVDNLDLPADLQRCLFSSGLFETPHCFSFLEHEPLAYIHWYLKHIRTNITTDLVSRAVDGFWKDIRVKERINFDTKLSCLLLDKRLLRGEVDVSDDEGIIEVGAPSTHYARVSPEGVDIISWILDRPQIDVNIMFQRPIRLLNQDLWLAVMRIIQYMCRKLETKYQRRKDMVAYCEGLHEVKNLCMEEDRRRKNVPENQWKTYASILTEKCQEHAKKDGRDSNSHIAFMSVVKDVLEGAKTPIFEALSLEDDLTCVSQFSDLDDDVVSKTIETLHTSFGHKFRLIDPKILMASNSRSQLLEDLKKLSIIDGRSVILPILKLFLQEKLEKMMRKKAEERSDAASAFLLQELQRGHVSGKNKAKKTADSSSKKEKRKLLSKPNIRMGTSGNRSVDQKKEVHGNDPSDESGNISEQMKTDEAEQLELVGSDVKVNITEDPSSKKEQREDIQIATSSDSSVDQKKELHGCDSLEESINRSVGDDDEEIITEDISSKKEQREDIQMTTSGNSSVSQKKEEHGCDLSEESRKPSELVNTERAENLEHVGGEGKASIREDPSSTKELREDFQMTTSGNSSVDQKIDAHGYDQSEEYKDLPELIKTEETEQLEHVVGEGKAKITEDLRPDYEPSSRSEQLNSLSNPGIQKQIVTAEPEEKLKVPESASVENKVVEELKQDLQLKEADSSTQFISTHESITYDPVLDMILKSLWHIGIFKTELADCLPPVDYQIEDRDVVCALQNMFSLFGAQEMMKDESTYHRHLSNLSAELKVTHPMANGATELLMAILEYLHYWKNRHRESLVNSRFTLEEFERMRCNRCKQEPNYPAQSSYGIVTSANSIRKWKSEFGDMKFENILKLIRMDYQIYCNNKTGGCGKRNYVRHVIERYPAIFIIALEWEKTTTKREISATANALATEIDISVLYEGGGVDAITTYRLVSMIGCAGERDYNCIAYENDRWVRHDSSVKEAVGEWRNVVRFCRERRLRPEVLFFVSALQTDK